MAKKVLILSSSPRRRGNSDTLCDEFMRGAIEGGNEVEKVFLRDKNIHPCLGCSVCSYEKKPCPQKDDAAEVIQKMLEADVIVMGTPVYFLCDECADEDADRPLLRSVYRNEEQRILLYRYRGRRLSFDYGTHR